jgi:hypothetical protein
MVMNIVLIEMIQASTQSVKTHVKTEGERKQNIPQCHVKIKHSKNT